MLILNITENCELVTFNVVKHIIELTLKKVYAPQKFPINAFEFSMCMYYYMQICNFFHIY